VLCRLLTSPTKYMWVPLRLFLRLVLIVEKNAYRLSLLGVYLISKEHGSCRHFLVPSGPFEIASFLSFYLSDSLIGSPSFGTRPLSIIAPRMKRTHFFNTPPPSFKVLLVREYSVCPLVTRVTLLASTTFLFLFPTPPLFF